MGKGGWSSGASVSHPEKTIWVGGIPEGTQFKDLLQFAKTVGDAKWAEVMGKTAAVGFGTPEEAASAAASLNGASFNGGMLETDMWTRKPKEEGAGAGGKGWQQKSWSNQKGGGNGWGNQSQGGGVWQSQFQNHGGKGGGGGKGGKGGGWGQGGNSWGGGNNYTKIQNPEKTVWIGNIAAGTKFQELLELAKQVGDAKWAEVRKTTGVIGFTSAEEAASAVASLNGAQLGGSTLEADLWAKASKQAS